MNLSEHTRTAYWHGSEIFESLPWHWWMADSVPVQMLSLSVIKSVPFLHRSSFVARITSPHSSCWHIALAFSIFMPSSQTMFHWPLRKISTFPLQRLCPSTSLISKGPKPAISVESFRPGWSKFRIVGKRSGKLSFVQLCWKQHQDSLKGHNY